MYLLFWSPPWLAVVPVWVLVVVLVAIVLETLWAVAMATGYHPATPEQRATLAMTSLWHVTDAEGAFDAERTTAHLDPARCRWLSRACRRDRPWKRRCHAVYVFAARPRPGQVAANVRRRRQAWLLELEGSDLTETVLIRRDGALALPDGFTGRLRGLIRLGP